MRTPTPTPVEPTFWEKFDAATTKQALRIVMMGPGSWQVTIARSFEEEVEMEEAARLKKLY